MHSFPIVMCVSGTMVGLYGWIRDNRDLEVWSVLALLIAGVFVVPAYVTGLVAADVVADRTFVRPGIIQTHRFAATWAGIPVFTAGALAAFSLHESEDRRLRRFVIAVGVVAAGAIAYAAWMGAQIEHGEEAVQSTETTEAACAGSDSAFLPCSRPPAA
jgi:TctA family transporter